LTPYDDVNGEGSCRRFCGSGSLLRQETSNSAQI
jgi:hypothetical protein